MVVLLNKSQWQGVAMRTNIYHHFPSYVCKAERNIQGVTLIELLVFITVTSVIVASLAGVYRQTIVSGNHSLINNQLLSLAQSQLEEIVSRKYDENSPIDGTACDRVIPCSGIGLESGENIRVPQSFDDIDDFNGYTDEPLPGFTRRVNVAYSGANFGINQQHVKRISVSVIASSGESISLHGYRVNH